MSFQSLVIVILHRYTLKSIHQHGGDGPYGDKNDQAIRNNGECTDGTEEALEEDDDGDLDKGHRRGPEFLYHPGSLNNMLLVFILPSELS